MLPKKIRKLVSILLIVIMIVEGVGESGCCLTAHPTCYQEPIRRRSVRLRMEEMVL